MLGCAPDELDAELDALASPRADAPPRKLRVDDTLRDRARTGRYAYVHDRGADFAAGIWVVDPVFMLDAIREALDRAADDRAAARRVLLRRRRLDAPDLRDAAQADRERRHDQRQRQLEAARSNLGLGHDLRAGLIDPSAEQLHALRAIVCRLLARDYRDLIAYGAGWTDPTAATPRRRHRPPRTQARRRHHRSRARARARRRRPAARHRRPRRPLRRRVRARPRRRHPHQGARKRPHDPQAQRRAARQRRAAARRALWTFVRPMLSPRWPNCTATRSPPTSRRASTVDLAAHRGDSSLDDLAADELDGTSS